MEKTVAATTEKSGPGHISNQPPDHTFVPVSDHDFTTVLKVKWDEIRVPGRGENKTFRSGPILWKFRSDRGCWRVLFERRPKDSKPTNLGNIGKGDLANFDAMQDSERTAAILTVVRQWAEEKGIDQPRNDSSTHENQG